MPTVPSYGDPKVSEQGLPNIRVQGDVPLEALGGGQSAAQLTESQMHLGRAIEHEITKQKQEADQIAVMGVDADLSPVEDDLLNGQNGALTKRGKDAFAQPEVAVNEYRKVAQEKIGKLSSHTARQMATQRMEQNASRMGSTVMRHAAVERERFDDDETNKFITNETNVAIKSDNNDRIALAHNNILRETELYARRKGMSNASLVELQTSLVSKLNAGVVTSRLNKDNYPAAKRYYDENFEGILPEDERNLSKQMKVGESKYTVQAKSDEIFAKYPDPFTTLESTQKSAQDEIDAIQDVDTRRAVDADLEHRFRKRKQQKLEASENLQLDNMTKAAANPGVPVERTLSTESLSNATLADMRAYEAAANPPVDPNTKAWSDFNTLGREIASLSRAKYWEDYRNKMNNYQRHKADEIYELARQALANPGQATEFSATLSFNQRADETMRQAKIIPNVTEGQLTPDQKDLHGAFLMEADRQIHLLDSQLGRKSTPVEQQGIMAKLAMKATVEINYLSANKEKFLFQVPITDVPPKHLPTIKESLRKWGLPYNDLNVRFAYMTALRDAK